MGNKITSLLLRCFVQDKGQLEEEEFRKKCGLLEGWVSVILNIILFAVKLVMGLAINSVSLIADAVHTLADVITSGVVIVSFKVAGQPGDQEHPYGHGRAEQIAALIIAVLLGMVGIEFFLESVQRLFKPEVVEYSFWVMVALLITALVKEWMYRFARELGERIDSAALIGDAWHHRTDAIASAGVAVGLVGVLLGYPWIDAVLGLIVSLLIVHTAYEIGREGVNKLMGERPSDELVETITECALKVDGVLGIHCIELHEYGRQKYVTAHLEVSPDLDVVQAHELTELVEEKVSKVLGAEILIHIEPAD